MDFFKELLESFSRVKNRKLRLLEEESESEFQTRVDQATKDVINAVDSNPPAKGNPTTVGNATVSHTGTVAGGRNYATFKDNKLIPKGKSNFKAVITSILGGENPPKAPPKPELTPEEKVLKERETMLNRRQIQDLELRETLTKVAENAGDNGLEVLDTLTGKGTNLTWGKDGAFTLRVNSKVDEEATENLAGLIKEYQDADDQSLDPETSDFNCGQFKLYNGNVVLFSDSGPGSKGYVVSKSSKTSEYLADLYTKKTKCPPLETLSEDEVAKSTGAVIGTGNNARGNLMEPVAQLFCLQKYLNNNPDLNIEDVFVVRAEAENIYNKIEKEIFKLKESTETWIREGDAAMLPLEDMEEIDAMVKLVGGNKRYLKAMFVATRASNVLRNPDMGIRVGDEVTDGKKQDQIDMWYDREDAMTARRKTYTKGLTNAPLVLSATAGDIFKDKRLLQSYIDSKQIKDENQTLFYNRVSLKSLMQSTPDSHTTGSTTIKSMLSFLKGNGKLRSQFNKTGPKGRTPNDLLKNKDTKKEFNRIISEQEKINKAVDNLSINTTVQTVNGKKIQGVDSLKIQVDAVLKNMQSNLSWGELTNKNDRTAFNNLIKRVESTKNLTKKKAIELELRTRLKTFMMRSHMDDTIQATLNDKNKSDETKKGALLFAAAHTYKTGASQSDQTVVQKNYLESRKSYFSSHNGPFKSMLKSISNFKTNEDTKELEFDDWELSTATGSKWTKKGPPRGRSLSTTTSADGKISCAQSGALTTEESSIHDFLPEEEDNTPSKPEDWPRRTFATDDYLMDSLIVTSLGKIQEALGVLKEKMKFR